MSSMVVVLGQNDLKWWSDCRFNLLVRRSHWLFKRCRICPSKSFARRKKNILIIGNQSSTLIPQVPHTNTQTTITGWWVQPFPSIKLSQLDWWFPKKGWKVQTCKNQKGNKENIKSKKSMKTENTWKHQAPNSSFAPPTSFRLTGLLGGLGVVLDQGFWMLLG